MEPPLSCFNAARAIFEYEFKLHALAGAMSPKDTKRMRFTFTPDVAQDFSARITQVEAC